MSGTTQNRSIQQKLPYSSPGKSSVLSTPPTTPKRRRRDDDSSATPEPAHKRVAISSSSAPSPYKPGASPAEKARRSRKIEQIYRDLKRNAQESSPGQCSPTSSTPASQAIVSVSPSASTSLTELSENDAESGQVRSLFLCGFIHNPNLRSFLLLPSSLCTVFTQPSYDAEYDGFFDDNIILSLPDPDIFATPTRSISVSSSNEDAQLLTPRSMRSKDKAKRKDKGKGRALDPPLPPLRVVSDSVSYPQTLFHTTLDSLISNVHRKTHSTTPTLKLPALLLLTT